MKRAIGALLTFIFMAVVGDELVSLVIFTVITGAVTAWLFKELANRNN